MEWGFKGLTVSDYTAIEQLAKLQHVAADASAAGVLALNSGVDMELPAPSSYPELVAAVKAGNVSESTLNDAVTRVLTAKFITGVFEHPYADPVRAAEIVGNKEHAELARKVADQAIVLLKNKDNILPLDPKKIKTLAVIGPNADKMRLGTYSGIPPRNRSIFVIGTMMKECRRASRRALPLKGLVSAHWFLFLLPRRIAAWVRWACLDPPAPLTAVTTSAFYD
jgi:beta-glucosidase